MDVEKKYYPWIDAAKLLCALLVLYMHTYCFDGGIVGRWVKEAISSIGVPFFFIVSGFFYAQGLNRSDDPRAYFKKYFVRVLKMYLIWSVLVTPVSIWNTYIAKGDEPLWFQALRYFRGIFLSGSLGVYWYIHSLVINSAILYWAHSRRKTTLVFAASIVFFIVGVLYNSGLFSGSLIHRAIHVVFGSERNFFTVGLFYMMIGYLLRGHTEGRVKVGLTLLLISLLIETFLLLCTPLRFMHAPAAIGLFLVASGCSRKLDPKISLTMRRLSTAIYLIHFPFILLFDYYLCRGTLIDFPCTLAFSVLLYYLLKRLLPSKWFQAMFG